MAKGNWHQLGGTTESKSEAIAKVRELRAKDRNKHASQRADYRVVKGRYGYHIEFRLQQGLD